MKTKPKEDVFVNKTFRLRGPTDSIRYQERELLNFRVLISLHLHNESINVSLNVSKIFLM